MTVTVSRMRVLERERLTNNGHRILAQYDAHDSEIAISGLQLVRRTDGELTVWTPSLEDRTRADRRAAGRGLHWRASGTMRDRFLAAGVTAFEALAGAPLEQTDLPRIPTLAASWS